MLLRDAEPAPGFRRRNYRRHGHRFIVSLVLLVPVFFFGLFALDLGPDSEPIPTNHRLLYAALCLPWILLAVRMFRISVVPTREALVLRNVTRTKRFPWSEVERFEFGDWGGFPCGAVRLRDGRSVTAMALNPPFEMNTGDHPVVPRLLRELNEDLTRARAAGLLG